jgi:hypothetical protein
MSSSTDAVLAYGYDLGDGPMFAGLDDYEYPDWMTEDGDFATDAVQRLLAAIGFTEKWEDSTDGKYFDREEAAKAKLGVIIKTHCSETAPMYALCAAGTVTTANRGTPEVITELTVPMGARERLAWAIKTLGLDIGETRSEWLLFSYRG